MKAPKTYDYIDDLIMDVLNKRELKETSLDAHVTVLPEDPRKIRPNIAKVPKPHQAELIKRHKSRFSK